MNIVYTSIRIWIQFQVHIGFRSNFPCWIDAWVRINDFFLIIFMFESYVDLIRIWPVYSSSQVLTLPYQNYDMKVFSVLWFWTWFTCFRRPQTYKLWLRSCCQWYHTGQRFLALISLSLAINIAILAIWVAISAAYILGLILYWMPQSLIWYCWYISE